MIALTLAAMLAHIPPTECARNEYLHSGRVCIEIDDKPMRESLRPQARPDNLTKDEPTDTDGGDTSGPDDGDTGGNDGDTGGDECRGRCGGHGHGGNGQGNGGPRGNNGYGNGGGDGSPNGMDDSDR